MYALEIKQLVKTYKNGIHALNGINLNVAYGDFFALLGVNGAGKSTTIGLITTLLTKTAGTVKICGYDLEKDYELAKLCIGLVPQEFNLNIFETVEQVLINQAGFYGIGRKAARSRADYLLHELGLLAKRHCITRQLSGGMKRRLMIARALMHDPKILILDEPTAGIDIEIRRGMQEFLLNENARGKTIILTTHYLEEAEQLCKNIAIIDKGHIIKNTSMQQLLQTLKYQTLIFNTVNPIESLPNLQPFIAKLLDKYTFELRVQNSISLNQVFNLLTQHHLDISSVRNKISRLEELFLDLIATSENKSSL